MNTCPKVCVSFHCNIFDWKRPSKVGAILEELLKKTSKRHVSFTSLRLSTVNVNMLKCWIKGIFRNNVTCHIGIGSIDSSCEKKA